jgi:RND family efflux transporter MFP subunit
MSPSADRTGPRSPWIFIFVGVLAGVLIAWAGSVLLTPEPEPVGSMGPGGATDGEGDGGGMAGFGPSAVDVTAAVQIVAAEPVQLLGTVSPVRQSLVASEVDGLAAELRVDEGDRVRAGQILVRLRTANVEQQLAAAVASRDETEARLARAERDFGRLSDLLGREAVSQREFDQAMADRDALRQAVTRQGADIAVLEDQLARAEVRAPFAGEVAEVRVEVGEWIGRGDPILMLVDLSELEIEVPVAERFIPAVEPGFRVDVLFDAMPGVMLEGRVKAVVPQGVAAARTFPVLIRVANPGGTIRAGMAARVMAQLGSPQPVTLVPKDALVRRGSQVFIYRLNPGGLGPPGEAQSASPGEGTTGIIEQIGVEMGPARGQWQVVFGNVMPADLIIVRGNERVFPGSPGRVAIVRELPLPAADPARPIALDPQQAGEQ